MSEERPGRVTYTQNITLNNCFCPLVTSASHGTNLAIKSHNLGLGLRDKLFQIREKTGLCRAQIVNGGNLVITDLGPGIEDDGQLISVMGLNQAQV